MEKWIYIWTIKTLAAISIILYEQKSFFDILVEINFDYKFIIKFYDSWIELVCGEVE